MKTILGFLAAISIALSAAAAAEHAAPRSIRVPVTGMTVIVNHGSERRLSEEGWSKLDTPTPFTCASEAGCLVVIQAMASLSNSHAQWKICASVDEQFASPGCPEQTDGDHLAGATGNVLQSAQVAAGSHTLLTRVHFPPGSSPFTFLNRWEVHYTIYEQ